MTERREEEGEMDGMSEREREKEGERDREIRERLLLTEKLLYS